MPQLSQLGLVYQSQWFWLLLVLALIYFFVGRGIVPKVEATVDQRDAQIAADLAAAERLRAEADATEEAWRARINDAHAEAQALAHDAKDR
ncbi:MAG: F0F1 ATP synthase subunit B family protein, partial [Croceibacterium sp.]